MTLPNTMTAHARMETSVHIGKKSETRRWMKVAQDAGIKPE